MLCCGSIGFKIIYVVLTALLKFNYCIFFVVVVSLPRALAIALGKDFFKKNPEHFFAEGQG